MIQTKYQLAFIGNASPFKKEILDAFFSHIAELGLAKDAIMLLDEMNFRKEYKANAPTVALYFGGSTFPNLDILNNLVKDANIILPIVDDKTKFNALTPKILHPINGFELKTSLNIEPLVGSILEGLGLLRLSRRLFISYRRCESRNVAVQLYERFEESGFDVFLDTHSIKTGDIFQDELWHRMADTDVVVLLDTPNFLGSEWTEKELAKANAMSIGILQLVWPNHTPQRMSELSIRHHLKNDDFEDNKFENLKEDSVKNIISMTESLRARSLGARQDNIITEFMTPTRKIGLQVDLQPEKFITIEPHDGEELVIIPTIGIPHAFIYNQSEELVKRIRGHKKNKVFLLYDHRNIRDKWLNHLVWLDSYLPIGSIKITEVEKWLKTI